MNEKQEQNEDLKNPARAFTDKEKKQGTCSQHIWPWVEDGVGDAGNSCALWHLVKQQGLEQRSTVLSGFESQLYNASSVRSPGLSAPSIKPGNITERSLTL